MSESECISVSALAGVGVGWEQSAVGDCTLGDDSTVAGEDTCAADGQCGERSTTRCAEGCIDL